MVTEATKRRQKVVKMMPKTLQRDDKKDVKRRTKRRQEDDKSATKWYL